MAKLFVRAMSDAVGMNFAGVYSNGEFRQRTVLRSLFDHKSLIGRGQSNHNETHRN